MKTAFDLLTDAAQKEFWAALALRHCEHITPRQLKALLAHHGSAYEAFSSATQQKILASHVPKQLISNAIMHSLRQEKWRIAALHEWRLSKNFHGEIILWTDYRYPLGLKQIIDAPPFFYVHGDTSLLASPSVAIVGSRKYHPHTLEKTYAIARDLSACGICIISGMAKGIDFAAHSGALESIGKTIAILGCGADVLYPPEHFNLFNKIKESGLILSEFAPQTKPFPQNFPIRNRLVSGISEAVLVAEAAPKSGSLITARLALEQNRNVYVLNPIHENHSLGCHALIQDGAIQVEDAFSIIADISPHLQDKFDLKKKESKALEIPIAPSGKQKRNSHTHSSSHSTKQTEATEIVKQIEQKEQIPQTITKTKESQLFIAINKTKITEKYQANQQKSKKIYIADQVKKRPQLEETLPILNIDFANLANELMGKRQLYKTSDILSHRPKKIQNINLAKTIRIKKSIQNIGINFQNKDILNSSEENHHSDIKNKRKVPTRPVNKSRDSLEEIEKQILQILDKNKQLTPDEILIQLPSQLQEISLVSMSLLMLEVENYIVRLSGNHYKIL